MTPSKIFLYLCISFIIGVFLSPLVSNVVLLLIIISSLITISCFWGIKKPVVFGFCLIFLAFGVLRYQEKKIEYPSGKVVVLGVIKQEPDKKEKTIVFRIGDVLVLTDRYPEYYYKDKVEVRGKLEKLDPWYLKDGLYYQMKWPEITLLERKSSLIGSLFLLKNRFKQETQKLISPVEQGFLEALFFGEENNIPKEYKDKLNLTGTRHIAAVSGMNITIIASLILSLCLSLGFWRYQSFLLSFLLITAFVFLIGFPSSAVRAAIMAGILMVAQHSGRLSSGFRVIVFTATLMVLINPYVIRYDVGFQLSFLAILGLVFFQNYFSNLLKFIPFSFARTALAATFSAQIFTMPVLVYNFGTISLISPIANLLIVPILAPITILIFVFGISSMIFFPLAFLLSFFVWFCLRYIVFVIDIFSIVPPVLINNVHWTWLLVSYALILYFAYYVDKKERLKFLDY